MSRHLTIGGIRIDDDSDAFVVAEIGHNHQGSLERAKEMFASAAGCGVSAVKLQKRDNRTLFTRAQYDAPYESAHSFGSTYGSHREALEFGHDAYAELQAQARELDVLMFATAFDARSADFLAGLGVPALKMASGDLTNLPLLRHAARLGLPMLLSTGGGTMDDIARAVDAVAAAAPGAPNLCLMQCTASYPAAPSVMNLRVIGTLRARFPGLVVGLSDHHEGTALASVAYALGARVIEKHFTLDRGLKGSDHKFSLEPAAMRTLVNELRETREALGDGVKAVYESERTPLSRMSKKITAATDLPAGHVLTAADLLFQSPGDGLPPSFADVIIGRQLARPISAEEAFTLDHVIGASGQDLRQASVTSR